VYLRYEHTGWIFASRIALDRGMITTRLFKSSGIYGIKATDYSLLKNLTVCAKCGLLTMKHYRYPQDLRHLSKPNRTPTPKYKL
jgi:hypothetical protein